MTRRFNGPLALALAVLPALAGCGSSSEKPAGPAKPVVVLFTSDEHSQLFAWGPELDDFPLATQTGTGPLVGGVARRATLIQQARQAAAAADEDLILVSAGDNHMGCLSEVAFESEALDYGVMSELGYDATTLGNHELDFGPEALAKALAAGKKSSKIPPVVASNIHFSGTAGDAELAALYSDDTSDDAVIHPYRVIETAHGVRIGLVGYMGVNASFVAKNKVPVAFSEAGLDPSEAGDSESVLPKLYSDLQPVVDRLRRDEGVHFVIALAHGGVNGSANPENVQKSDDWNVCRNVSGIDFIVSGHAHNADPTPIDVVNAKSKRHCLVLNASALGRHLGEVHFRVPDAAGEAVHWSDSSLVPVDEGVVPDPQMAASTLSAVESIEELPYLPDLLGRVTGEAVANDPNQPGDLYFAPIAKTGFDVTDTHSVVYLSADAMLSAADDWGKAASVKTDMALESAGVIRQGLNRGKAGVISVADAFDVVPLGASPVDASIGYPLVRANLLPFELRAVFEVARTQGPTDSDYDLGMAGARVEYDPTRPLVQSAADLFDPTKGQVMRIMIDSDHSDGFDQCDQVIYDRDQGIQSTKLVSVVTSSYIAQFASSAGVTMKDDAGKEIGIEQAILKRTDQSELKQIEAFFGYLHAMPGGTLADRYDKASAAYSERWICLTGC